VIGTIEYRYGGERIKAVNTTPSALQLARLMRRMRDAGVDSIAMEVSSHALDQRRVSGIQFDCAVLTNITQDHLDYHKTMESYASAKRLLYFDHLLRSKSPGKPAPAAVFNMDDPWSAGFAREFSGKKRTFGLGTDADARAENIRFTPDGARFDLLLSGRRMHAESPLLAMFNVQNILGAAAAAHAMGISSGEILEGVRNLDTVSGRFERVAAGQDFLVIVDYSHTPDALERALLNAREMAEREVIVVFGCGGDRDNTKRPIMGRIAGDLADTVIVTNDNPRTEDPERIAAMVMDGVGQSKASHERVHRVLDRRAAIGEAIAMARTGDLVLVAGKGHEDYQILGTGTVHFDDREVAREFLASRVAGK
jgi:UDP-N-acetylmuramyl-tripeptide synthetase